MTRPPPIPTPGLLFHEALSLHQRGRLAEAERQYRRLLAIDPDHAGALHNLALILAGRGQGEQAASLLRRAIALDPRSPALHNSLGTVLQAQGAREEAAACYRQALVLDPALAPAQGNLGAVLIALDRPEEALDALQKAVALAPDHAGMRSTLGLALGRMGRHQDALDQHRRALALAPDTPTPLVNCAGALVALGRAAEAIALYRQAIQLAPGRADLHYNLGTTLLRAGQTEEAAGQFHHALHLAPDHAGAHANLGLAEEKRGRMPQAVAHYRAALALDPGQNTALTNLPTALAAQGDMPAALTAARDALDRRPDRAESHAVQATLLAEAGQLTEAAAGFGRAIALAPRQGAYYRALTMVARLAPDDPRLTALTALAQDPSRPEEDRLHAAFALGKALSDLGQDETAFRHLLEGNALMRRRIRYDEAATLASLARLPAAWDRPPPPPGRPDRDDTPRPVFILGMPRSGTSLVEQILSSHRAVFGAGERTDLDDLLGGIEGALDLAQADGPTLAALGHRYRTALAALAPPGCGVVTDKMPANFRYAGPILHLLPQARIVHVRRAALDTCLSCFATLFTGHQPFAYDLGELGRYWRAYDRMMDEWRRILPPGALIEIAYETLVAEPEAEIRRLLRHCGLDWDPACLSFHTNPRPVRTASAAQVRQPLYRHAIGRWRPPVDLARPLYQSLDMAP
jgi:tetratricopeptide (TPR) repeat protein